MDQAESKMIGGVSEVTLLTPIARGPVPGERWTFEQRLEEALVSVQRRVREGMPTPIGQIPAIHFARWIILRPRQYLQSTKFPASDPPYRTWLLFMSNFDGDMKSYLRDFALHLGDDVDRIWGNCEGWPAGGAKNFELFWDYAKRFQIPTNAFYAAYPHLSVPRIRQLERFKLAFDEFVAATRANGGCSVADLAGRFDEFLTENAQYSLDFPRPGGTYSGMVERGQ